MSPFQDDGYKRALYNTVDGGAPSAWQCKIVVAFSKEPFLIPITCDRITRTLNGMKMHQKKVHGFTEQEEIECQTEKLNSDSDKTNQTK